MSKVFFRGWGYNPLFTCDSHMMDLCNNGAEIRVGRDKVVANIAAVIDYGQGRSGIQCLSRARNQGSQSVGSISRRASSILYFSAGNHDSALRHYRVSLKRHRSLTLAYALLKPVKLSLQGLIPGMGENIQWMSECLGEAGFEV